MADKFSCQGEAAVGTDKTILSIFNPAAAPTSRPKIYDCVVGCSATPADQAGKFQLARSTALGTEGSGYVPNNLDPGGPAGACDSAVAHSAEPTYTSVKELLLFGLNQRATFRWVASPGSELLIAATQNNGVGLKSKANTGTAVHQGCMLFEE